MLQIVVPKKEYWIERKKEFIYTKEQTLCLEHSLVSISKWESKWHKPFIYTFHNNINDNEIRDYVKCMTLTQNVDPNVYFSLSEENVKAIFEYINDPMTATTFRNESGRPNRELITSELIYCWMTQANIPFECQKWHLNRLLTLIRVCNIKNQPEKKRNSREIISEYKDMNEQRKKLWNTAG